MLLGFLFFFNLKIVLTYNNNTFFYSQNYNIYLRLGTYLEVDFGKVPRPFGGTSKVCLGMKSILTNSMAYGTRKFIAAVTKVRHWILSWAT